VILISNDSFLLTDRRDKTACMYGC